MDLDDIVGLAARMQRSSLCLLASHCDSPLQVCAQGAAKCRLSSKWKRRCREVDVVAGWIRKLTPQKIQSFLAELEAELSAPGSLPTADAPDVATSHGGTTPPVDVPEEFVSQVAQHLDKDMEVHQVEAAREASVGATAYVNFSTDPFATSCCSSYRCEDGCAERLVFAPFAVGKLKFVRARTNGTAQ